MEQKMPWKRRLHLGIIVVLTVLLSVLFAYLNGLMLDGFITYLAVDAVFFAILIYMLENNRLEGKIGNHISNHYNSIAYCYGIFCVLVFLCYFLPAFTFPAAALALFMSIVSNPEIAISITAFFCVISGMATGGNFYELASCVILILTGAQMAKTMRDRKYRIWGCMILAAVSLMIPMLFYYLAYSESSVRVLVCNIISVVLMVIAYGFMADRLYDRAEFAEIDCIEKIVKEDYPLVLDIKKYSRAEYVHAMKVSTIARKCAAEIGANEMVVAAAGFYYRLGILEGEPFVENGVRLAEEKCFPGSIIRILSEYNGELRLPSSKESAIVHMVDACLKKIEMLSGHNLSTSWNQDMVIYQTLNELSGTGIYDESGLSMNQFLKVRELLVREEIGYDNND